MQIGLINYKNQLDQQKNKTQPTDKRSIQRQLKIAELETLQSKKVDLQDIDKSLFKINPHHYPKTEFVNKRIIQLQVQTSKLPEEEIDKFSNYLEEKSKKQYVLGTQKLTEGLQSAQSRFLLGKQRMEQTEFPKAESKYIKSYHFGALKSALKQHPVQEPNDEQLIQQQQQIKEQQVKEQQEKEKEALELQGQVSEQSNVIRLHKILGISKGKKEQPSQQIESNNEQTKSTNQTKTDLESSKLHFLNVFKQDNMINTQLLEEVYPTVKFEEIERPKNNISEDHDILRRLSILNSTIKQPAKITFNDEVKVATFINDEYFAEEGTIFRSIDELTNSIRYAQSNDKMRLVDKPQVVKQDDVTNWSQNIIHYYNKKEIQQQDPEIFEDVVLQDEYQRQRYNNIYVNTTQKKDFSYFRGGDPSESIQQSLRNLQNMKCHQYVSDKNLDIQLKGQVPSQIENVQKENDSLVNEFAEQDLEQKDILSQFQNKQSQISKLADTKGYDISQGVEKLSRLFNSNQCESKLEPNFNGVTQLNGVQFTQIPQKQEHYSNEEKEKFKDFYSNFQDPLDILHKHTGTYQQAIEMEQDYLQRQLDLKCSFQIGKLPRPLFYANQHQLPEKQMNGNQHQILVMPDKEQMKRYKYRILPMDVVTARQVYQKY